jgi:DNA mismatch endonuclease, patch repair protein
MRANFKFNTTRSRSELMKKIRSQNTEPERILRKELWKLGYRYRKNVTKLPGKPDIVIEKMKLVIFIDGEFWHGYKWKNKKPKIKANRKYWIPKIEGNMKRDNLYNRELKKLGYKVLRFWEHQIRKDLPKCIAKIQNSNSTQKN